MNTCAYHCFPSDPSPLLIAQHASCSSQLYQTVSGYENMLLPAAKPQACRTNSNNLSGFWDMSPGQTLSINRPVVCVVTILIFALGVNYSLQSRNCNKASVTDKEKNFQPVCCFLCLAAKRQELFLAVGMTSSLKEIKHCLFVLQVSISLWSCRPL